MWNRLNLSIVCHIILKMWHEPSFIYVLPWFLLAQASLWIAKVIGNKWDGPVGLQAHLLYLLCPDLITRSMLCTALHHQCLQGFSIQSAKTASSLPLASIHIPAAKLCPLPTAATQHLDHPCQPASSHSPRSTAPLPTAVKSSKPQKRAGKTDRMANQITQWHSRYYEGLFCILCNMSGKTQRMHTCSTTSQLNGFLPEGFLKQQSPRPVFH